MVLISECSYIRCSYNRHSLYFQILTLEMASANLISLSEKIDDEMKLFRKNINKYKAEVIRITEEMKHLIDKKSDELLKELDDVLKEVNKKKKKKSKVVQNLKEIQEHQKAMKDLLCKMDPSFTLMTEVSEKVETIKKEIDTEIPVVKLIWKVNALRDSINNMCSCKVETVSTQRKLTSDISYRDFAVTEESTLKSISNPFNVNPPRFNINDSYDREVEAVSDTPVTPKSSPSRGKLEGNKRMDNICALRVIAYFEVNGRDVEISGSILTTLSDKSGKLYYELHTDKPVHFQIRDKEIKLKAPRTTAKENSLFVTSDQCIQENPEP